MEVMRMKVLVYGAGVIGCYLAHVLCQAKNKVTLLARGAWRETLEENGLTIHHHLQRKTTTDHPEIVGQVDASQHYDVVFTVMQFQQMQLILDDLARIDTMLVVLVGNDLSAPAMEREILVPTTFIEQSGVGQIGPPQKDAHIDPLLTDKLAKAFQGRGKEFHAQILRPADLFSKIKNIILTKPSPKEVGIVQKHVLPAFLICRN
jgi:hypothetical protein